MQTDRAEGGTLALIAADQLGGQVLCLGGRATVAGDEDASPGTQELGEVPAPGVQTGEIERGQCVAQVADVASAGRQRPVVGGCAGQRLPRLPLPAYSRSVRSIVPGSTSS